jgi:hypothetical protein
MWTFVYLKELKKKTKNKEIPLAGSSGENYVYYISNWCCNKYIYIRLLYM